MPIPIIAAFIQSEGKMPTKQKLLVATLLSIAGFFVGRWFFKKTALGLRIRNAFRKYNGDPPVDANGMVYIKLMRERVAPMPLSIAKTLIEQITKGEILPHQETPDMLAYEIPESYVDMIDGIKELMRTNGWIGE